VAQKPPELILKLCRLRTEHVDDADYVTSTDRTLGQSLAAVCARHHVTTVQQETIGHSVHAHLTQVALERRRRGLVVWWTINCHKHQWMSQIN